MDYKIKSRIWIEANGNVLLGEGRISLLKAIDELGSLSKASKSMNMSYNKAWNLVDSINKSAKKAVLVAIALILCIAFKTKRSAIKIDCDLPET